VNPPKRQHVLLAVDSGINGAIASFSDSKLTQVIPMPTLKIEVKSKLEQLDLDVKGKKQFIKSGPNKGKVKMKLRRPAKHKKIINTQHVYDMFKSADTIILERQQPMIGNSSSSSFTIGLNYGRLLALAELSGKATVQVMPSVWKKYLGLGHDKQESVDMAEALEGIKLTTDKGRLMHDEAEAILLGNYYLKKMGILDK
jgi:hypothetical protein